MSQRLAAMKPTSTRQRGSTLIDVCAACVMGSVTMALALPSYQSYLERTRRGDAVSALQRVQQAQERHLATHGQYALRVDQLGDQIPELSQRGLYRIAMFADGPDSFEARATAVPDREQVKDPGCSQLTLRVTNGVLAYEPSARCWNP
jgi:type IV pilus assembly protein PilE